MPTRWRSLLITAACLGATAVAAQAPPSKPVVRDSQSFEFPSADVIAPARFILDLADKLQLSETQMSKLAAMERAQDAARSRAAAAFMRAEADLLDAIRVDDLPLRRTALEKRAKIAIDAEMGRLQAEQDTRSALTSEQRSTLMKVGPIPQPVTATTEVSPWRTIVAPPSVTRLAYAPQTEYGEVRISVTPIYADIYVDNEKAGAGRKVLMLPVGSHNIKVHAVGCVEVAFTVTVEKGPPQVIPPMQLTCSGL